VVVFSQLAMPWLLLSMHGELFCLPKLVYNANKDNFAATGAHTAGMMPCELVQSLMVARVGQYFNKSPILPKQVFAIPLLHVFFLHNIIA